MPESIKAVSDEVGGVINHCKDSILCPPWSWARHGESGLWVSDRLPLTAAHADRLCLVRSMHCDSSNHAPATWQMNTGSILGGKPALGGWLTYGLGSENADLPGYVLLFEVGGLGGSANWSNGFLPAAFQGTRFRHEGPALVNLSPPAGLSRVQRPTIDLAQDFNRRHLESRPGRDDLEGRIASYELAWRMQSAAGEVGDLSGETAETLALYRCDDPHRPTASYGRMCLLARRMVERGVRVVQLYNAVDKYGWDGHDKSHDYHERNARQTDAPTAALLADLERRGLLDETLVVWGGEFGRTPMEQGDGGRNHNPYGFTVWLAGGGVRGGRAIGASDEIGLRAPHRRPRLGPADSRRPRLTHRGGSRRPSAQRTISPSQHSPVALPTTTAPSAITIPACSQGVSITIPSAVMTPAWAHGSTAPTGTTTPGAPATAGTVAIPGATTGPGRAATVPGWAPGTTGGVA